MTFTFVIICILVCAEKVTEFKCQMRLRFSAFEESRWNEYVVRFILVLWELLQVFTYHQPCNSKTPLLKLVDFRLSGKSHLFEKFYQNKF